MVGQGSSPLTRGKRHLRCYYARFLRLIPAHAGKTLCGDGPNGPSRAHPRSRGENAAEETAVDIHLGSSPLTRGKHNCPGCFDELLGLIPAHAGKTTARQSPPPSSWAHPRSRGENQPPPPTQASLWGSSPLTRGKPGGGLFPCLVVRLIPAHAGKTPEQRAMVRHPGAHPRSRGENPRRFAALTKSGGSSPLTRGKRRGHRPGTGRIRLIPAHAGKTNGCVRDCYLNGAHPRSRGENRARRRRA